MAAEKLTKGRLIQIVTILILLTVAFFWRTFSYKKVIEYNCLQSNCQVLIDQQSVQLTTISNSPTIIRIYPFKASWQLGETSAFFTSPNGDAQANLLGKQLSIDTPSTRYVVQFNTTPMASDNASEE